MKKRKRKYGFYNPDPEEHFTGSTRNYWDRTRHVESYVPFETGSLSLAVRNEKARQEEERIRLEAERKKQEEREARKRARIESVIEARTSEILKGIILPTEFGDRKLYGKAILLTSYRYGRMSVRWNDFEDLLEVRFASAFFDRVRENFSLSGYPTYAIDGCHTKIYVSNKREERED